MKTIRLALLISGGGTTASVIIKAFQQYTGRVQPCLVIASSSEISGIKRVQDAGFPKKNIVVIDPTKFSRRDVFADRLIEVCEKYDINLVGQYGWLPLTPKKFIERFEGRIINQHPGPLDPQRGLDFGGRGMWGRRVHAAVLLFRRMTGYDMWTEATTHFVTSEFDKGAVVKRKKVTIMPDDTVESLQKRLLEIEYEVQIEALKDFAEDQVKVLNRKEPLIKKTEEAILEDAKKLAGILYPNG